MKLMPGCCSNYNKIFYLLLGFQLVSVPGFSQPADQEATPMEKQASAEEVFQVVSPDYNLSPHTGMTKKHWEDAALYLLEGAFSYVDDLDDPMKFPKLPGKSYPHDERRVPTEKLEGICRTLFLAAPLLKKNNDLEIKSMNVAEYYRHQILQLVDPNSAAYIQPRAKDGGPSQNLVEFGALAISLFVVPEVLWDPLTQTQKDQLAAIMLSYGDGPTVDSNWKFFNVFILSFFQDQGYEINTSLLEEYLVKSLEDYRGQGWYNDHPAYDYYSMWSYQMYGLLWAEFYGNQNYPQYASAFRENFSELKDNYPYLFSENGEMVMWGRSISYRMASVSPFPLMGLLDDPSINYGWMRRISSGTMLQFLQHPDFLKDRVPTLGFYGHFEPAVQEYSARGSVYWMGKVFLSLLVPEENPFWQAVENEGPWEDQFQDDQVYHNFQEASNILITDYPGIGASEIRAWCHAAKKDDWQNFRSGENYNRLSYNSAFPWQADGADGEVAMNYVFKNKMGEWEPLRLYTFRSFKEGVYYRDAVLESSSDIQLRLAEIPLSNGILRVDKNISKNPVELRLGHYALGQTGAAIKQEVRQVGENEVHIIDNGTYQLAMIPVQGWDTIETLQTTGLHPEAEHSKIINVGRRFSPDTKDSTLQVSIMLWKNSGEPWTQEELMPVDKVVAQDGTSVLVVMKNGEEKLLEF